MKHIHFDVESDGFYGAYWAHMDIDRRMNRVICDWRDKT